MNILFLCTAHNSLSQRLYLTLSKSHNITIEYALSDEAMIEASKLFKPHLIICPFLTTRVPREVYENYLTLIIHPGPPGDAGPSALDWVLMGDDGTEADPEALIRNGTWSEFGRSYWGVTVLQAVEEFDAGPVWAFEQFPLQIDSPNITKSSVYRGPVTRAALTATSAAIERIQTACMQAVSPYTPPPSPGNLKFAPHLVNPLLQAKPAYRDASVTLQKAFLGGVTRHRPLLKAAQRDFNVQSHTAREISRRIRSSDSQPGCLTKLFGPSLYVYGGIIEESDDFVGQARPGKIIAYRDDAVCVATCDEKAVWITHVRRVKKKTDVMLWPKVPAVSGLQELGIINDDAVARNCISRATVDWSRAPHTTQQDVWVDFETFPGARRVAFLYFEFYNGAMSTEQCTRMISALDFIISTHVVERPLSAVVLMGGEGYFSNGIALNVIEAAADPALESWLNINRIDDVVHYLLHELPSRKILTIAGIRGNCAAGGVAMAAACDIVLAGTEAVLNPAYRAIGLHGSEYHSLSYTGRCGSSGATKLLRDMRPLSTTEARTMGLVDHTIPGSGALLDTRMRKLIKSMLTSPKTLAPGIWKSKVDVSPAGLACARAQELGEMSKDFWSPRSSRYHLRRRDFVRKIKAAKTPLRFAAHRRSDGDLDEEESDEFDDVVSFERKARAALMAEQLKGYVESVTLSTPAQHVAANHDSTSHHTRAASDSAGKRDLRPVFSCYYDVTA
ncbi:formyl transferase domain-containing protein [Colletotrichum graminicola]|uniref:Formyl transferase domain-containing protein n=1 Tax=Colletotrichum graminicola (strain M1.001 / M2 / FGSC 10212) TaxID=645133 RepID=E3QS97_COLGM|nr:formyl transferase domain-containing protein [Colletotrichum graminicola M1.001]EFQ33724.1 formyl transferase domain-containing protein [Colletotrichum graminicola M1.001]WDK20980.1 formyl transferase domain-containing protein [Colletotrichum graminicola]